MKFKRLLGHGVTSMVCALGYFRKVIKEISDLLVRALAMGREFICDDLRVLFTPHGSMVRALVRLA